MSVKMNKLERCPCCANQSSVMKMWRSDWDNYGYRIRCTECKLSTEEFALEATAIQSWNHRPTESSLRKQLEEAREALQDATITLKFIAEKYGLRETSLIKHIDKTLAETEQK